MSIPKMEQDVEIIQKLSDLPNTTDGLTAQELKAKFDEAAKLVKAFLNEVLIPAIQANNIPFEGNIDVPAENVQDAILQVQQNMRDVAAGSIVNGSVTKEKLSAELLARVYGGLPWVSMKTPDSSDNVAADFPIGQVWFRPAFEVVNARTTDWTGSGCTVAAAAQKVTLTGNNTATTATMTQSLTGIGQEGDTVYILFDVTEQHSEITGVTAAVNGEAAQAIGTSVSIETELMADGSLTLEIGAIWPAVSLAGGNLVVENLAIVNVDQIVRQLTEGQIIPDWSAYLRNLLPLDSYYSRAEVYIQMTDGDWWPMVQSVLPADRGGTGYGSYIKGQMLYADSEQTLKPLDPAADNSFLLCDGSLPRWKTGEQVIDILGQLRVTSGSYTGTGKAGTVSLPVTPKLLYLYSKSGSVPYTVSNSKFVGDLPTVLTDGVTAHCLMYINENTGVTSVTLSGSTLTFAHVYNNTNANGWFLNRSGIKYGWIALY